MTELKFEPAPQYVPSCPGTDDARETRHIVSLQVHWLLLCTGLLSAQAIITKYPRPGVLRQQKYIFAQFWRLEVEDQGSDQFYFQSLTEGHLLSLSSHGQSSVLTWRGERVRKQELAHGSFLVSFLIRTLMPPGQGPTLRTALETTPADSTSAEVRASICESGARVWGGGQLRHKHSIHNSLPVFCARIVCCAGLGCYQLVVEFLRVTPT